jgi:uncharacterized protein
VKGYIKRLVVLVCLLGLAICKVYAQTGDKLVNKDLPAMPNPPRLVNDFAHVLSADDAQRLENKLVHYNDSTSTQITIVVMPSVDDDIASFGARLGDFWGIGRKQKDNGILISIDMAHHHVNIATGRGAEGAVPDVTARKIIDNYITPNFRNQDYYKGLDQATTAVMQAMAGEFKGDGDNNPLAGNNKYYILAFIILFIVFSIMRGNGGNRGGNYGSNGFLWGLGTGMLMGGGRGGSGFGGGGGGGFGGFGGGSFGGGGASGSW